MEQQNRNSIWPIALAIVTTAIVVGGGMYWWQGTKTVPVTKIADTQSAQPPATTPVVETKPVTATIEQGNGYDSPQWEKFTSDLKAKSGENVESFYTPKSPSNNNVVFVSTSGGTTGEWPNMKSTNKIYSYNIQTGELTKLYEELENRLLRTMGIEGTKLIVMYDGIDNSPGPCFSIWADWDKFGYLDTTNSGSGLRSYTVPSYQVEKGKAEQKKCQAENGL
ncbi:MAG: hypothetical protein WC589_24460 [Sphingobacterium sp.]